MHKAVVSWAQDFGYRASIGVQGILKLEFWGSGFSSRLELGPGEKTCRSPTQKAARLTTLETNLTLHHHTRGLVERDLGYVLLPDNAWLRRLLEPLGKLHPKLLGIPIFASCPSPGI